MKERFFSIYNGEFTPMFSIWAYYVTTTGANSSLCFHAQDGNTIGIIDCDAPGVYGVRDVKSGEWLIHTGELFSEVVALFKKL